MAGEEKRGPFVAAEAALLQPLAVKAPAVPVVSCITGAAYSSAEEAREVWVRHATAPVDFVSALNSCLEQGVKIFVQVGAGGALLSFARGVATEGCTFLSLGQTEQCDGGAQFLDADTIVFSSTATDPNTPIDPELARNGNIYSIEEASGITDHPNGTLDWVPVTAKAAVGTGGEDNVRPEDLAKITDVIAEGNTRLTQVLLEAMTTLSAKAALPAQPLL